jgi:hypothetical protein
MKLFSDHPPGICHLVLRGQGMRSFDQGEALNGDVAALRHQAPKLNRPETARHRTISSLSALVDHLQILVGSPHHQLTVLAFAIRWTCRVCPLPLANGMTLPTISTTGFLTVSIPKRR